MFKNRRNENFPRAGVCRVHRHGGRKPVLQQNPVQDQNLAPDLASMLEEPGADQRLGRSRFDFYRFKNGTCGIATGAIYEPLEPESDAAGIKNGTCGPYFQDLQVPYLNHSYLTTPYHFFLALFHSSKMGQKVRAARRLEISDLGFLSDLARDSGGWRVMAATPAFSCAGRGAAQVYPVLERVQRRNDPLQCVEINTVRRFGLTEAFPPRSVTKRVRLVGSTFRLGRRAAQAVGGVTPTALVPFESLVAENQQASMRKTSKLAAGWR